MCLPLARRCFCRCTYSAFLYTYTSCAAGDLHNAPKNGLNE